MLENCKLFNDIKPLEWWLNKTKLSPEEDEIMTNDMVYVDSLNGDVYDLEHNLMENDGDVAAYNSLKNELFSKIPFSNMNNFDLIMKKRATIHIKELFKKYVDDETLVILNNHQHFSVETEIKNCKNVLYYTSNCDLTSIMKYKKIFVYVIGMECDRGIRYDNTYFKYLHDELTKSKKQFIMVLDAVQEMFLYPRDYSFYHYIIGTTHCMYHGFDQGLLFINKNIVPEEDIKSFTGYKRCDVLERLNRGLDIILKRKDYILTFNEILSDCIDKSFFGNCKKYCSQNNFYSIGIIGDFLYNKKYIDYINKLTNKSNMDYAGISISIDYSGKENEMIIRMRAQTLMFETPRIIKSYELFYNDYLKIKEIISMRN